MFHKAGKQEKGKEMVDFIKERQTVQLRQHGIGDKY